MALKPTKSLMIQNLGSFWTELFNAPDIVEADATTRATFLQAFEDFASSSADYVSVDKIPAFRKEDMALYVLADRVYVDDYGIQRRESATVPITYNGGTVYNEGATYNQVVSVDSYRYPIPAQYLPYYLANTFLGTSEILIKDRDYTVDGGFLVFDAPLEQVTEPTETLASEDGSTIYVYNLWGFANEVDEEAVQNIFGYLARISGTSGTDYNKAVSLAWDLQVTGATTKNVDKVLSFLSSVDYYDGPGEELVQSVFLEAGRRWVETVSGIWGAPLESTALVQVGETLVAGQQLFDRYTIYDATILPDPADIPGVELNAGFLGPVYTGPIYLENALVDVELTHPKNWYYVDFGDTTWQIRNDTGKIITVVNTEEEARAYLNSVPEDMYTFPISTDSEEDWYSLMLWLNNSDFFTNLAVHYGRVPSKILPLRDLRDHMFGNKLTIISVKQVPSRVVYTGQLIQVLSRTWPAGMTFIFHVEHEGYDDLYEASNMSEQLELFQAHEHTESFEEMAEFILPSITRAKPPKGDPWWVFIVGSTITTGGTVKTPTDLFRFDDDGDDIPIGDPVLVYVYKEVQINTNNIPIHIYHEVTQQVTVNAVSFLQSAGDAVSLDGVAYEYDSQDTGTPTTAISAPDAISIGGITYDNPDPNAKSVYTAGERALSLYEFGIGGPFYVSDPSGKRICYQISSSDPGVNDDGSSQGVNNQYFHNQSRWVNCSTGAIFRPTDLTTGAAVWEQVNSGILQPTTGGVLRVCGLGGPFNWYLNDVYQNTGAPGEAASDSRALVPGDQVYATGGSGTGTRDGIVSFLPTSY